jgi:hypothetical protein
MAHKPLAKTYITRIGIRAFMKFQLLCADYLFVDCPNRHDARRYAIKLGYAFKLWHIGYHGLIPMSSSFIEIRVLYWFGEIILKPCSCIYFKNKEPVSPPNGIVKIHMSKYRPSDSYCPDQV